jgi:hypothetical protein
MSSGDAIDKATVFSQTKCCPPSIAKPNCSYPSVLRAEYLCAFDNLGLSDVFGVSLQESWEIKLMPLGLILQDIQWVNLATKAARIMSHVSLDSVGVGGEGGDLILQIRYVNCSSNLLSVMIRQKPSVGKGPTIKIVQQ